MRPSRIPHHATLPEFAGVFRAPEPHVRVEPRFRVRTTQPLRIDPAARVRLRCPAVRHPYAHGRCLGSNATYTHTSCNNVSCIALRFQTHSVQGPAPVSGVLLPAHARGSTRIPHTTPFAHRRIGPRANQSNTRVRGSRCGSGAHHAVPTRCGVLALPLRGRNESFRSEREIYAVLLAVARS